MSKLEDLLKQIFEDIVEKNEEYQNEKEEKFENDLKYIDKNNPQIFRILMAVMRKVEELHDAVVHLYKYHNCGTDHSKETKH